MKVYLADTNLYLRFLLRDKIEQANKAEDCFNKAKKGQIKIIFLSIVINEIAVILKLFYKQTNSEIAEKLLPLIKTPYLEIEDKQIWYVVLEIFSQKNIDLLDIFIFYKAKSINAEVLSFDRDIVRLTKAVEN